METFGEYLRTQRERKGIRLEEIASITKIHLHTLQFLENGNWAELPPEPFIRGFIIAYAKYVGLEPKAVLERYALEHGKSNPQGFDLGVISSTANAVTGAATDIPVAEKSPDAVLNAPRTVPVKKIAMASGGVLFLVLVGLLVSLGKQKTESVVTAETKPAAPAVAEVAPPVQEPKKEERILSSNPASVTVAPKEEEKPKAPEFTHELILETKEKSWGKIVIDDSAPVEFYSTPGKKVTYQAKQKVKLVLGNSSGAVVEHNGEVSEGKRFNGTIKYYVFPQGARFPQDVPKRKEASQPESPPPAEQPQTATPESESGN